MRCSRRYHRLALLVRGMIERLGDSPLNKPLPVPQDDDRSIMTDFD
ncbi:MAG: hypothetical protein R3C68_10810 [Myxococcota bacterium]